MSNDTYDPSDVDMAASVYSDVFKEQHGFRPRWVSWEGKTADEIWLAVDELIKGGEADAIWREEQDEEEFRDTVMQDAEARQREEEFQAAALDADDTDLETVASRHSNARLNRKRHRSNR